MGSIVCAEAWGGWSTIIDEFKKTNCTNNNIWPFVKAFDHAEMALSVLHELCRYRSGCDAVASVLLEKLAALPLWQLQICQSEHLELRMTEMCRSGMLEQALIDTIGRCVAGCHQNDLRDTIKTNFASLLDQLANTSNFLDNRDPRKREFLASNDIRATDGDECFNGVKQQTEFVDRRFLNHTQSLANLRVVLESSSSSSSVTWKSTYCMERVTIPGEPKKSDLRTLRHDKGTACRVCFKTGSFADKTILRCGKCKIAAYCSVTCQRADWPTHKKECVRQRIKPLPGNEGYFTNTTTINKTTVQEALQHGSARPL